MNDTRTGSIGGALASLRRDKRGNTLAMAAASLIPIVGMVGSGLDASRTYLAKTRLQSACDAGALAARKVMDGSGSLNTAATTAGTTFFENNFPTGTYATSNRTFATSLNAAMEVKGIASVRVPMTLMKIFNYNNIDLNVTCSARLDITNTDVMFVLDTTGSMNECPDGSACSGNGSSKIAGLRTAVTKFATTLSGAAPSNARIRYGFVPYSSTVNVGGLLNPSWINSTFNYQSRVANFNVQVTPQMTTETATALLTESDCHIYGANRGYPTMNGPSGGTTDANGFTTTGSVAFLDWGATGTTTGTTRTCRRNATVTVSPTAYRFGGWTYGSTSYNTAAFKSGSSVPVAMGDPPSNYYVSTPRSPNLVELAAYPNYASLGGAVSSFAWDNCIQERDTVPNATFTYGSIPSTAYDLDVDRIPSSSATSWRAKWPQVVWDRNGGGGLRIWDYRNQGYYACPTAAAKLAVITPSQVSTYVNSLVPVGGTYHDVGMIWGARLISATGLFASENTSAPNGQAISRNIIFMTDGQMAPSQYIEGLYGYERLDQRITGGTPNDPDLTLRHNSRFVAVCNAARAQNVKIYVIGFGTALNNELTACADPGQAYTATNTAALEATFTAIATQIAKLRLSQ